jgi:5'-3' exonuclease
MFVVGGYGAKSFTFDSQSEVDQLMRKITMDVAFIVRLANPSRVIFAFDSKSWRKQIQIEENEGYKGQRKQAAHINWDNVYAALAEFSEIMKNNGLIVSKIDGAEADDIIALWASELQFKQNQHVIIVTGDEDMRQLVKFYPYDKDGASGALGHKWAFTTVFNPFSKPKVGRILYVPDYFINWLNAEEQIDIWNMSTATDIDKVDFRRIRDTEKVSVEQIDGTMIAMRKVFCGDDGDNVPSLFTWLTKDKDGNDKENRITPSKFEKIYEMIKLNPDEKQIDHINLMERTDLILKAIKEVTKQTPPFKIEDRLMRQIKLIILDPYIFPEKIVEEFNNIVKAQIEKPRANYSSINMQELLNGTRYVSKSKGTVASIFKEIDKVKGTALF